MKLKLTLNLMAAVAVLILIATTAVVQADPWSAIDSGYAVTTNYHGEYVVPPPAPPLKAKVGLLKGNFYFPNGTIRLIKVQVDLRDEDENVVATVFVYPGDFVDDKSPQGADIKIAWTGALEPQAPYTWIAPHHYSVKAYFYLKGGKGLAHAEDLDAMRATTVLTIPEVPLGTITILVTMLASLAIIARKRF